MSHLDNARCLFIDGPVAVYLQQAPEADLLEAYERLFKVVKVAAATMNKNPLAKMDNSVEGIRGEPLP